MSLAILGVWAGLAECQQVRYGAAEQAKYAQPTVAVALFESPVNHGTAWDLSTGFADELSDRLMDTRRYRVLPREARRKWGADKQPGAQYLVKGVVTDFGPAPADKGLLSSGLLKARDSVIVAVRLQVVDLLDGEVLLNRHLEARSPQESQRELAAAGGAFGSYTFYHTSYGQATEEILDDAVKAVVTAIEERPYQPKIASILNRQVIVNGGQNRKIAVGDVYIVRTQPQRIADPDSGEVLGYVAGQMLGRVRITQVTNQYSIAAVMEGEGFEAGQPLFPYQAGAVPKPTQGSSY